MLAVVTNLYQYVVQFAQTIYDTLLVPIGEISTGIGIVDAALSGVGAVFGEQTPLFAVIVGGGIIIIIAYALVKWVVGIITGS